MRKNSQQNISGFAQIAQNRAKLIAFHAQKLRKGSQKKILHENSTNFAQKIQPFRGNPIFNIFKTLDQNQYHFTKICLSLKMRCIILILILISLFQMIMAVFKRSYLIPALFFILLLCLSFVSYFFFNFSIFVSLFMILNLKKNFFQFLFSIDLDVQFIQVNYDLLN